jgi:hypothetical protein
MSNKLTMLERYWKVRLDFEEFCKRSMPTGAQLWSYQELVYRISVLEVFQLLKKKAPISSDMKTLTQHYQAVNGYIEHLRKERFHQSTDPEKQKQQQTAQASLMSVVEDYRRHYNSYRPVTPDNYRNDIGRTIATVLPAWVQYRDTVTEIKISTEEAAT